MKIISIIICIIISQTAISQVIKDLNNDGLKDSISFDPYNGVIIAKLSTEKFKPIYSHTELSDEINSGVVATKQRK